jgi:hypothetical protein
MYQGLVHAVVGMQHTILPKTGITGTNLDGMHTKKLAYYSGQATPIMADDC